MKAEKYLKLVFLVDKKLYDAIKDISVFFHHDKKIGLNINFQFDRSNFRRKMEFLFDYFRIKSFLKSALHIVVTSVNETTFNTSITIKGLRVKSAP